MRIQNLFLLRFILLFLLGLTIYDNIHADDPPVIINRSHEVHEVGGKKYYFHAVLKGQTLFSIARAYGVTVEDIKAENPELEHGLRYDQLIKIPYFEEPHEKEKEDYIEHKVRRRETLFGISQEYDVSVEELLKHNPEARKGLQVNQVIRIPVEPEVEEVKHKTYEVSAGETFYSLSRKFDVSVEDIINMNPELEGVLKAGETIKLPYHAKLDPAEEIDEKKPVYVYEEDIVKHEVELWDRSYCQEPDLKEQYNVALLIPLFLEDLEEYYENDEPLPVNHRSLTFLEFYEGVLIALDSVKQFGANINLHVYDVCQDTTKAREVLNKPEFREMDFIIGSFFSETLSLVAEFAERHGISVVSPFLQDASQLSFYSNVFQFTPSLTTQLEDLADYIAYKYPTQNIILVHNNQPGVANIISDFNNRLNKQIGEKRYFADSLNLARVNGYYFDESLVGERATNVRVFNDSLLHYFQPPAGRQHEYSRDEIIQYYLQRRNIEEAVLMEDSVSGIRERFSENRINVLVSLFGGEPAVSNYIRELSLLSDTFDITVFGVPQWRNYRNLEIDHLQDVNAHIISPDFVDYSDRNVQDFVKTYRDKYNNEPGTYAFKGVETGFYFMNALMTYGREFYKCIHQLNQQGDYNSIKFRKTAGKNFGWENTRATIYTYDNYRIIDIRSPVFVDR